jgi:hypothetical protein
VVTDARTTFHEMSAPDIKKDGRWKQKEAHRLKPLDQMTPQDRADFLALMNKRFPKK